MGLSSCMCRALPAVPKTNREARRQKNIIPNCVGKRKGKLIEAIIKIFVLIFMAM